MSDSQPRFRRLELAACGWLPADWSCMFYPEDLPEEWRVSYYANEFDCVLLSANDWNVPKAQASFWKSEIATDFRFYLEITPQLLQSAGWSQVRGAVEEYLASQLKGLLLPEAAMSAVPQGWHDSFALHVQRPDDWLTVTPVGAEAQIGLLKVDQAFTPQDLRKMFERLQRQTMHPDVTLFMDAPWAVLEQFRLMKQLYGV